MNRNCVPENRQWPVDRAADLLEEWNHRFAAVIGVVPKHVKMELEVPAVRADSHGAYHRYSSVRISNLTYRGLSSRGVSPSNGWSEHKPRFVQKDEVSASRTRSSNNSGIVLFKPPLGFVIVRSSQLLNGTLRSPPKILSDNEPSLAWMATDIEIPPD